MSTGLNRWLGPMPADRVQRRRGPADAMRRPTEPGCAVRPADCAAGETEPWAQIRNGRLAPRFAPGGPRRHSLGGGWWIRLRMGFCCGSIQRGGVNQARPPRMVTVQSCFSISWWWTGRAGPRCRGLFGRRRARIGCGAPRGQHMLGRRGRCGSGRPGTGDVLGPGSGSTAATVMGTPYEGGLTFLGLNPHAAQTFSKNFT